MDPETGVGYAGPRADAVLRAADVLLVDEAGMLDQDAARALLTIADEHHARVALVGDRHQLAAVGRGGVLDLAVRHVQPQDHRELDTVHRFTRTVITPDGIVLTAPDEDYAQLSLAMRAGDDPTAVFDALTARGQIRIHATDADRIAALAQHADRAHQHGVDPLVVADTNEQVAALNDAIRAELVLAAGVDDTRTTTGRTTHIGAGDRVVTRLNDTYLDVANRDAWSVTGVGRDGSLTVTGERGQRVLPAEYVRAHVELGYASTVHGVQGDTAATAHLAVGEHTSAASAYVGMTRGRNANTAHLVADSIDDARDQWLAVFARDRADLGPAHAAELATREADRYAQLHPLEDVLGELRDAWTVEANAQTRLADAQHRRELLRDIVAISQERGAVVPALHRDYHAARTAADSAGARLRPLESEVTANAAALAATLKSEWEAQRQPARDAAQTVRRGNGRLGQRRAAVRDAREHLEHWAQTWRLYLPAMPADLDQVVSFAAWFDDTPRHHATFDAYARTAAEHARPDYLAVRAWPRARHGMSCARPNSITRWRCSTTALWEPSRTRTLTSRRSNGRSQTTHPHSRRHANGLQRCAPNPPCVPNRSTSSTLPGARGRSSVSNASPGWPSARLPSTNRGVDSCHVVLGCPPCHRLSMTSAAAASAADRALTPCWDFSQPAPANVTNGSQ